MVDSCRRKEAIEAADTEEGFYDAVNLKTRFDGRGVTTTYTYDGLNRISGQSYAGGGAPVSTTSPVTFGYDGPGTNAIGRLTSVSNGVSTTAFNNFRRELPGSGASPSKIADGREHRIALVAGHRCDGIGSIREARSKDGHDNNWCGDQPATAGSFHFPVGAGREVFANHDKALGWLQTPNPSLAGRTPIEAADTEEGFLQADEVLTRIEHGVLR
jgi:YD repeat-containing protein